MADASRATGGTAEGPAVTADDSRLPTIFGPAFPQIVRFAELLAVEGLRRGLVGPRELPRLWERHLVNSAAVAAFLPASGTLVDVGSGAGLPGVVLAAMRPELHVVLLEPMERRANWLLEVVAELGLNSTEVVRGRAEELHGRLHAVAVTARAVAPMDRLAIWTLPLLAPDGVLLALKGSRAAEEVATAASVIRSLGGDPAEILDAPTGLGFAGTRVVRVVRRKVPADTSTPRPRASSSTSGKKDRASRRKPNLGRETGAIHERRPDRG